MERKSYWIWHYGDYEAYHFAKVCLRREEYGVDYPPMWKLDTPYSYIEFFKDFETECEGKMTVYTTGGVSALWLGGARHATGEKFTVPAGKHKLKVQVAKTDGLPAIYVDSDVLVSDGSWGSALYSFEQTPVGYSESFDSPDKNPEEFPFSYERITPVCTESTEDGVLYDFGRETFGYLNISGADAGTALGVFYGESREEALDTSYSILREEVEGSCEYRLRQRAFRYVFIRGGKGLTLSCDYEYLPYEYKGDFKCDNELYNKIYDVCAYTLHLNCREAYFDGIKRDRWIWGGDAYQSARFNAYLFADADIDRRTALGLVGKAPYFQHINRIIDYTMLWIIGLWEHYMTYGDADFIKNIYPRAKGMIELCESGRNDVGFIVGKPREWTFIDWSSIDKTGAVSAEQILLVAAFETMAKLSVIAGETSERDYFAEAAALKKKVNEYFWSEEKGAFIDSYESGANNVTRHANIFAVMYDIATPAQKESILKNVLKNDSVTKITTPYFEGYELDVLAKLGDFEAIEAMLDSYWGGMIRLGATTIWEEFHPEHSGTQHYAMYSGKYAKSLCHAWGAGPIYLFGRYYLGVYPTGAGYSSFEVAPCLGGLNEINGTVPAGQGTVKVSLNKERLCVFTDISGGTLIWQGKRIPLIPGKETVIEL